MRHLISVLVVTVAAAASAQAEPAKPSPFSNKAYGDGGGYKHPDAAVGQFFETKPQDAEQAKPEGSSKPEPGGQAPAKVAPEIPPSPARASRPRPRPFASVPAKSEAPAAAAAAAAAPARAPERVLDAQVSVDPPAASAASADADGAALDSASEDARRDYESRLFGAAPEPRRPRLEDPRQAPAFEPPPSASIGEGMLFVSLELDAQEAGSLRDAVAGLGSAAAFRPDDRFQPLPAAGGSVRISGWLPASRLGDAISRPGVRRVEVERGSRPSSDARVTGSYLVALRVPEPSRAEESIAEDVRELTRKTGFALDRVLGVETSPSGGSTALVSGTFPVAQLARALGIPGVIRISAAGPVEASAPKAPVEPPKKEGFLKFVMGRSLWLVLLTVLLALPTVGGLVRKGLAVFVPYR